MRRLTSLTLKYHIKLLKTKDSLEIISSERNKPMDMKKSERNSAIEVLRIIAVFFIICSHYVMHGNFELVGLSINKFLLHIFKLGNLGVAIFVMISGYYMINQDLKIRKLVKISFEVLFYSVSIYLFFCIGGEIEFHIGAFFKVIFPTIFVQYWFVSAFIALYILSPFLNMLLKRMSIREMKVMVILIVILWSLIPSLTGSNFSSSGKFACFIMYYLIGASLKVYPEMYRCEKNVCVGGGILK